MSGLTRHVVSTWSVVHPYARPSAHRRKAGTDVHGRAPEPHQRARSDRPEQTPMPLEGVAPPRAWDPGARRIPAPNSVSQRMRRVSRLAARATSRLFEAFTTSSMRLLRSATLSVYVSRRPTIFPPKQEVRQRIQA